MESPPPARATALARATAPQPGRPQGSPLLYTTPLARLLRSIVGERRGPNTYQVRKSGAIRRDPIDRVQKGGRDFLPVRSATHTIGRDQSRPYRRR
ncbi:MAG: hypothetical protein ACJ788_25290 [Ktedonobacteraceae bacterium]